ncbi:hypothetical protein [Nocardia sp. NPDC046763]|uniref:hypothetical protein n=1 Tax=Nocardia sp. NPDC046763 TaxID=3155256 RepID=UPI0033EB6E31
MFYTPNVAVPLRELRDDIKQLYSRVNICIDQHVAPGRRVHETVDYIDLVVIDESERLSPRAHPATGRGAPMTTWAPSPERLPATDEHPHSSTSLDRLPDRSEQSDHTGDGGPYPPHHKRPFPP